MSTIVLSVGPWARGSLMAEVSAWAVISDIKRRPVFEDKALHYAVIVNALHGAPVHKDTRALVGKNELHQRTKILRGIEEMRFARRFCYAQPIH
jgi:hypothetical protein